MCTGEYRGWQRSEEGVSFPGARVTVEQPEMGGGDRIPILMPEPTSLAPICHILQIFLFPVHFHV